MERAIIENNKNQLLSETDSFTIERYHSFLKYFKRDYKRILDFGCNTGRGGAIIKTLNQPTYLIGADIIKERLQQLPSNTYDQVIDLSDYSLEEKIKEPIDVVVSGEVVEHIPFTELVTYLKFFHFILAGNGVLLLTTPNPDAYLVRMGRDAVFKEPSHVNIMSPVFLKTVLHKTGFRKVEVRGNGKMMRYLGDHFPLLNFYGSFLIIASK